MTRVSIDGQTEVTEDFKMLMLTNLAAALNIIDSAVGGDVDTTVIRCGFGRVKWSTTDNRWYPELY